MEVPDKENWPTFGHGYHYVRKNVLCTHNICRRALSMAGMHTRTKKGNEYCYVGRSKISILGFRMRFVDVRRIFVPVLEETDSSSLREDRGNVRSNQVVSPVE